MATAWSSLVGQAVVSRIPLLYCWKYLLPAARAIERTPWLVAALCWEAVLPTDYQVETLTDPDPVLQVPSLAVYGYWEVSICGLDLR